jgi:hypothetical protein
MEAGGVSYKGYMEAYPGGCRADSSIGTYYRKHNPLISFNSVRNNATRCAKIVNATEFDTDLNAGTLPNWSYYTPDINNDGHNTNVKCVPVRLRARACACVSVPVSVRVCVCVCVCVCDCVCMSSVGVVASACF